MALDDLDFEDSQPEAPAAKKTEPNPATKTAMIPRYNAADIDKGFPPGAGPKPGDCSFLDIETVPDESRVHLFPLEPMPAETPLEKMLPATEAGSLTVEKLKDLLSGVTPSTAWLNELQAKEDAREKGPRKEVVKLITEKRDAMTDRVKEMSLNPFYCRVVSIGIQVGDTIPRVMCADTPLEEFEILSKAWVLIQKFRPVIGFNLWSFDLQVMLVRSAILGVEIPFVIDRRKYGSADFIDLQRELYGERCPKGHGMKPTAKMLGVEVPENHGDGSQVYELWKAGNWPEIMRYQRDDLNILAGLYAKLSGKFCK